MASDRRQYLDDMMELLYPAASSSGTGPIVRDDLLLPSPQNPRVAIPRLPRVVASQCLREYKRSSGLSTRLGLHATALVVRSKLGDALPARRVLRATTPDVARDDIAKYLSEALGRPVFFAFYTSAPRANRKPVLHVFDAHADVLAYVKLGVDPITRALVEAEAETLRRLAAAHPQVVQVPALLYAGRWREVSVLAQSALAVTARPIPDELRVRAMLEVCNFGERVPGGSDAYQRTLRDRIEQVPDLERREILRGLGAHVLTAPEVPVGAWHGDWTPWNCAATRTGLSVWDWERFTLGVPRGFDALHYAVQTDIVRHRIPVDFAVSRLIDDSPRLLAPFGIARDLAIQVTRLYLLDIGTRYVQDRQASAGATLGMVENWLVPALTAR